MQHYSIALSISALGMSPAQTQSVGEENQSAARPCLVQGCSQAMFCGRNGSPESCTLYSVGRMPLALGLCCDWGHTGMGQRLGNASQTPSHVGKC